MQEQNASKATSFLKRFGVGNLVGTLIFGALMLAAALIWLLPYSTLPTASWREVNDNLPWEKDGLCLEEVRGCWLSSSGHERMALRAACYPVAELELGEAEGSGMLYVRFIDSNGRQAGDTIALSYSKGQFLPRQEVNIQAEGKKARVFVETGYDEEGAFRLHQLDESIPLWRVSVFCRPEGTQDMQPMGYVTIPARLQQ